MPAYKAPLRDIRFLMNEVFDYPAHYQTLTSGQNADADTVDMILEGGLITAKTYFLQSTSLATKKVVLLTTAK